MGQIEGLRTACAMATKAWGLAPEEVKEDIVQCPCAGGVQDPEHVVLHCAYTEEVRQKVVAAVAKAVEEKGTDQDKAKLADMDQSSIVKASLSSSAKFSPAVEKAAKAASAAVWNKGLKSASKSLVEASAEVAAETTACVYGHKL